MALDMESTELPLLDLLNKNEIEEIELMRNDDEEANEVDLELALAGDYGRNQIVAPSTPKACDVGVTTPNATLSMTMGPKVDEAMGNSCVQSMRRCEMLNMIAKRKRDADDVVARIFSSSPSSYAGSVAPQVMVSGAMMSPSMAEGTLNTLDSTCVVGNMQVLPNVCHHASTLAMASGSSKKGKEIMMDSNMKKDENGHLLMKSLPLACARGPNGKLTEGILYKYSTGFVRIVCVCHGSFFTPQEFVMHAGGTNVENALKQITISDHFEL